MACHNKKLNIYSVWILTNVMSECIQSSPDQYTLQVIFPDFFAKSSVDTHLTCFYYTLSSFTNYIKFHREMGISQIPSLLLYSLKLYSSILYDDST